MGWGGTGNRYCICLPGQRLRAIKLTRCLAIPRLPQVGAFTNIACYWLLAVPLAYHLAFPLGWGLTGLWVGAATANALQAAIILTFALRFDYRGEAAKAAARFALHRPLLVGSGEEHA